MVVLDSKQKKCLRLLKKGHNLLVSGPGGSGKSTLLKSVIKFFEKNGKKVGVTATTGSAALLIEGTTLHSYLGIGLGDQTKMELYLKLQKSPKRTNWIKTDLLVIDEVSMLSPELFDKLHFIGQQLRGSPLPFGGMQILLSGDFYQLPVVKCGKFVFEAASWKLCIEKIVILTQVKRQANPEFRDLLNRLRVGDGTNEDFLYLKNLGSRKEADMEIRPTKLFCKNEDVDALNIKKLNELDEEEVYKYVLDVDIPENAPPLPRDFDPTKKCNAPQIVKLCKGAEVLLLYNINVEGGLANGSRGVVTGFTEDRMPIVKFLNGVERTIEYVTWEIKESRKVVALVSQIPLRLAYAITIHKSQGMSLESAFINLSGVFEYGQAYVALSRVKTPDNLIIKNATRRSFRVHPKAKLFYKELSEVDSDDELVNEEEKSPLYFDGACKSNPGPASGEEVASEKIEGEATNNIAGLEKVCGDSLLAINQMENEEILNLFERNERADFLGNSSEWQPLQPIFSKRLQKPSFEKRSLFSWVIRHVVGVKISFAQARKTAGLIYTIMGGVDFTPKDFLEKREEILATGRFNTSTAVEVAEFVLNTDLTPENISILQRVKGVSDWTISASLMMFSISNETTPMPDIHLKTDLNVKRSWDKAVSLAKKYNIETVHRGWLSYFLMSKVPLVCS